MHPFGAIHIHKFENAPACGAGLLAWIGLLLAAEQVAGNGIVLPKNWHVYCFETQ
jgi:hypothetical protein